MPVPLSSEGEQNLVFAYISRRAAFVLNRAVEPPSEVRVEKHTDGPAAFLSTSSSPHFREIKGGQEVPDITRSR